MGLLLQPMLTSCMRFECLLSICLCQRLIGKLLIAVNELIASPLVQAGTTACLTVCPVHMLLAHLCMLLLHSGHLRGKQGVSYVYVSLHCHIFHKPVCVAGPHGLRVLLPTGPRGPNSLSVVVKLIASLWYLLGGEESAKHFNCEPRCS